MKTLTYMEVKNNFPVIWDTIRNGEEIVVSTEKRREKIAVIIPYERYQRKKQRPLGILKGKATYNIKDNLKITDEEFLFL